MELYGLISKAELSYWTEISSLLMDRKDWFLLNFLTENLNLRWWNNHLVEDNFSLIQSVFDRFKFKKLYKDNEWEILMQAKSSTLFNSVLAWKSHRSLISDFFQKKWRYCDESPFWILWGKYDDFRNPFKVNFQKIINSPVLLVAVLFTI